MTRIRVILASLGHVERVVGLPTYTPRENRFGLEQAHSKEGKINKNPAKYELTQAWAQVPDLQKEIMFQKKPYLPGVLN